MPLAEGADTPPGAGDEPRASAHGRVRDRARRDLRGSDDRRREWAAVADAHTAVPAEPDRGADYDGFDALVSREAAGNLDPTADGGAPSDVAVNLVPAPDHAASRTAPHVANPKRLGAHLAAAAPCRLCPLDWSDHGPPFR